MNKEFWCADKYIYQCNIEKGGTVRNFEEGGAGCFRGGGAENY